MADLPGDNPNLFDNCFKKLENWEAILNTLDKFSVEVEEESPRPFLWPHGNSIKSTRYHGKNCVGLEFCLNSIAIWILPEDTYMQMLQQADLDKTYT